MGTFNSSKEDYWKYALKQKAPISQEIVKLLDTLYANAHKEGIEEEAMALFDRAKSYIKEAVAKQNT